MASLLSACRQSQYYRDQGAGLGALTGAVAGAAIGDKNGEALAGAAIGGVAGALVGSAIGDGIDQDVAHAQAQAVATHQTQQRLAGAVTLEDTISMTHGNLSDDVIVSQIRSNGVARRPQVDELITLRNAGVSDQVIRALQTAPLAQATPVQIVAPPRPVVVEEHHYVVPAPRPYRYYSYPHRHRPPPPGVHWGMSISK